MPSLRPTAGALAAISSTSRAPTRTEALGEALAQRIVSGALRPGQRLDEQALAAEFGVSRTPVREALRLLVTTGLVELRARRGALVAAPKPGSLRDTFEVLAELEALCARWAALRMTARERIALEIQHNAMATLVRAGDRPGYRAANRDFHQQVYLGSHNDHLAEVAFSTHRRLAPFRGAQFEAPQRLARSHIEHGLMVAGILRGDADGAAEAMRRHILSSGQSWENMSAQRGTGISPPSAA